MSIEFEGLDELLEELGELANLEYLEKGLQKACALVERSAKQNAPKGDGKLRNSIKSKVEDGEGIVYTPLEYAPYVEYGTGLFAEGGNGRTWDLPWTYQDEKGEYHKTSGMKPHPYMRPALNENREQILRLLKENLLKND